MSHHQRPVCRNLTEQLEPEHTPPCRIVVRLECARCLRAGREEMSAQLGLLEEGEIPPEPCDDWREPFDF